MTDKASLDVDPETRERLRELGDDEADEAAILRELVDEATRRRDGRAPDRWPASDYY